MKNVVIGLRHKASSAATVKLILRYITMAAAWSPSYTIEVDSSAKKAQLHLYAHVTRQWTDVEWSNVNLRLSTANATISAVPPKMTPVYLAFDDQPTLPAIRRAAATGTFSQQNIFSSISGSAEGMPYGKQASDRPRAWFSQTKKKQGRRSGCSL